MCGNSHVIYAYPNPGSPYALLQVADLTPGSEAALPPGLVLGPADQGGSVHRKMLALMALDHAANEEDREAEAAALSVVASISAGLVEGSGAGGGMGIGTLRGMPGGSLRGGNLMTMASIREEPHTSSHAASGFAPSGPASGREEGISPSPSDLESQVAAVAASVADEAKGPLMPLTSLTAAAPSDVSMTFRPPAGGGGGGGRAATDPAPGQGKAPTAGTGSMFADATRAVRQIPRRPLVQMFFISSRSL